MSCTLVSVHTLQGDGFIDPKAGNEYIVAHVKIVNKSDSEQPYTEFDFHAKSGSGNITDVEIPPSTYTANDALSSGQIAAGGTVEGDVVLQVPMSDHQAAVTWQPSIFGENGANSWLLGL